MLFKTYFYIVSSFHKCGSSDFDGLCLQLYILPSGKSILQQLAYPNRLDSYFYFIGDMFAVTDAKSTKGYFLAEEKNDRYGNVFSIILPLRSDHMKDLFTWLHTQFHLRCLIWCR